MDWNSVILTSQNDKLQKLISAVKAGDISGAGIDAELVFERLESKYKSAASALQAQQCGSVTGPVNPHPSPLPGGERE